MRRYSVELKSAADRALRRLPVPMQKRIVREIEQLAENPRPPGAIKLAGEENAYRIRIGDYRVLYEIHDKLLVVLVVRIGHRRDVYRRGN